MAPKFPMPVGGEAGAWVKGKFGNMRSRRFGRRAARRYDNRVWVPYLGANGAAGRPDYLLNDGTAQQLVQIVAGFGLGPIASVGSSASTMEGLAMSNILRMQGGVYLTCGPTLAAQLPGGNAQYPRTLDIWYYWQRQELTPGGNTGSIESAANYDPSPYASNGGLLVNILRESNILRWGCVRLHVPDLFDPTATPSGSHRGDAHENNLGFIPCPRISPKFGLKLHRRQVLSLMTVLTPGDTDPVESSETYANVRYMPAIRMQVGLN